MVIQGIGHILVQCWWGGGGGGGGLNLKIEVQSQCGKFVSRGGEIPRALLMLSIYLLLNFPNLPRAISKLSSQGAVNLAPT
jgi:hypothetical protein